MLITFSYRASVFYLISTLSGLECLEHFYLRLFWEASFWLEWKCVAHWLLPSIRARQDSSGVHSKPLNTAFSCSCPEVSKPQGLCGLTPSNSLFFHFSLEMWRKKRVLHQCSLGSELISMELCSLSKWASTCISWQTHFSTYDMLPPSMYVLLCITVLPLKKV